MMRRFRRSSFSSRLGMSFMEVLVATTICTVVSLAAIGTFVSSTKSAAKAYRFNKGIKESHLFADTITRDVRGALRKEFVYFDGTTTHSGNSTLVLRMPRINGSGDIIDIDSTVYDRVVYEPSPDNPKVLPRKVFPGAGSSRLADTRAYGDAFTSTAFTGTVVSEPNGLGTFVIYYQYMIERKLRDSTYLTPVTGSVRLRNKDSVSSP